MGHYLHFLVIEAEDGDSACGMAENDIVEYGNENNWRTAYAAVNHAGEVWFADDGVFSDWKRISNDWLEGRPLSWAGIADLLNGEVNPDQDITPLLDRVEKLRGKKLSELNSLDLWSIGDDFKSLSERQDFANTKFTADNLHEVPSFWGYTFDKLGLTNLSGPIDGQEEIDLDNAWVVLLDWHE